MIAIPDFWRLCPEEEAWPLTLFISHPATDRESHFCGYSRGRFTCSTCLSFHPVWMYSYKYRQNGYRYECNWLCVCASLIQVLGFVCQCTDMERPEQNVECRVFVFYCLNMWSSIRLEVHHFGYIGQAVSSFQSAYISSVMLGYCYAQPFLRFYMTSRDPDLGAPLQSTYSYSVSHHPRIHLLMISNGGHINLL